MCNVHGQVTSLTLRQREKASGVRKRRIKLGEIACGISFQLPEQVHKTQSAEGVAHTIMGERDV